MSLNDLLTFLETSLDEEPSDHDELVAELSTLNLMSRDIDSLKHTAILLTEADNLDLESAAIWLSALNNYKNTTPKGE